MEAAAQAGGVTAWAITVPEGDATLWINGTGRTASTATRADRTTLTQLDAGDLAAEVALARLSAEPSLLVRVIYAVELIHDLWPEGPPDGWDDDAGWRGNAIICDGIADGIFRLGPTGVFRTYRMLPSFALACIDHREAVRERVLDAGATDPFRSWLQRAAA